LMKFTKIQLITFIITLIISGGIVNAQDSTIIGKSPAGLEIKALKEIALSQNAKIVVMGKGNTPVILATKN